MRSSWNAEIGVNENGSFAINLGSDSCAEHEHGIDFLKSIFGIDNTNGKDNPKLGVEKRRITRVPSCLDFIELTHKAKKYACITTDFGKNTNISQFKNLPSELFPRNNTDVTAAWDERDFGVLVTGADNIKFLRELYAAFQNLDVSIWLGKSGPFQNGGLIISIVSKLEQSFLDQILESDLDAIKLLEMVETTGIITKLKNANKIYYDLTPKWANTEKTDVVFFLNPKKHDVYRSGWYAVKDLEDWIEEKGPIIRNGGIDK